MNNKFVDYREHVLPRLRCRYCPMCRTALTAATIDEDNIRRAQCAACGWVHYPANALGVNVVVRMGEDGVAALLPAHESEAAPAALPSGHVEYGESPEEAAVRESARKPVSWWRWTVPSDVRFTEIRAIPAPW